MEKSIEMNGSSIVLDDKLLTVDELAEMLQVPKTFVYRLNHEKRGPKLIRLGRRTVRYRLSDVTAFIDALSNSTQRQSNDYLDPFK